MLKPQQPTFGDEDLIIEEVAIEYQQPMALPKDVIYSTNPRFSVDSNSRRYYSKGGEDVRIVQAELIGHILAGLVRVPVPHYVVGRLPKESACHFCSCILEDALRDVEAHLRANRLYDSSVIARIILLDIWLGNPDRNMGNLLGRGRSDGLPGAIEVVAIDFEKSMVVRNDAPLIEIPLRKRGEFWPRGVLGTCCRGRFPLTSDALGAIRAISAAQIERAVVKTFAATRADDHDRRGTIIDALVKRQLDIEKLAKAEWN